MSKGWKVFLGVTAGITALSIGLCIFIFWSIVSPASGQVEASAPAAISQPEPVPDAIPMVKVPDVVEEESQISSPKGKMYVLAMGVDARGDYLKGRTDAMVVISLDKKTNEMNLLSIPRDSYVELVGKGKYDKITHAYAYGGAEMATKTVEGMLGIKIDHYVVFNFTSFMKIVDALGGVTVDVPYDFTEQNSEGVQNAIKLSKGEHVLNGEEALAYARMRHQDPTGDIGRGSRQQDVIKGVFDSLLQLSSLSKISDLYSSVKGSIRTDVDLLDLPGLFGYLTSYNKVQSHLLTGSGQKIDGVYYFKVDEQSLQGVKQVFK
jgi:LCP family protein required for cell wall assembly